MSVEFLEVNRVQRKKSRKMSDLSELEKRRLENINRNASFLAQLGFAAPSEKKDLVKKKPRAASSEESKQKKRPDQFQEYPTRYSRRLKKELIDDSIDLIPKKEEPVDEEDSGINYSTFPIESAELDDFEFEIYVYLKAWRLRKCRELDIEPYKICQNRTITELIRRRRNNREWANKEESREDDLLECWGIGPSKAKLDGFGWEMIIELEKDSHMAELFDQSRSLSNPTTNESNEKEIIVKIDDIKEVENQTNQESLPNSQSVDKMEVVESTTKELKTSRKRRR